MIKKLLPVIFLIAGTGAGIGAGKFLGGGEAKVASEKAAKVEKADKETKEKPAKSKEKEKEKGKKGEGGGFEYLKLTKQFVVPIVEDEEISALVTMSLSLEANSAITETFYAIEPKLRDGFLQVLFDHANTGGFDGAFTHSDNLGTLRKSLLEVAKKDLGDDVSKVLIMSVSRQDT
jgi:hypothetical protein